MKKGELGEKFIGWALTKPHIRVLFMIGSRVHNVHWVGKADGGSDWDFQVVTSDWGAFGDSTWLAEAGLGKPLAYVVRRGRLGGGKKVSIVVEEGELDIVVISFWEFTLLRMLYRTALSNSIPKARNATRDLGVVWKGGVVILKGSRGVIQFVRKIRSEWGKAMLDDEALVRMAEGFVCDYVSTRRKVNRGELIAAQRWLHFHLIETNLILLHEWRQRAGLITFPDARRVEAILDHDMLKLIALGAKVDKADVSKVLYKTVKSFETLMGRLLKNRWHWPELPSSLRVEELCDDVF